MEKAEFIKYAKKFKGDLDNIALVMTRGDGNLADEIVKKTYRRAHKKFHLFKGGNLKGWLIVVMRNIFIDHIRKYGYPSGSNFVYSWDPQVLDVMTPRRSTRPWPKYLGPKAPPSKADVPARYWIKKLFTKLPYIQSHFVILRYLHNMSEKEIVEFTGRKLGTIKSSLSQARKNLWKLYRAEKE